MAAISYWTLGLCPKAGWLKSQSGEKRWAEEVVEHHCPGIYG